MATTQTNEAAAGYTVSVHFGVGSGPVVVLRTDDSAVAINEARLYLSDSQGVYIDTPDGRHVTVTRRVAAEW